MLKRVRHILFVSLLTTFAVLVIVVSFLYYFIATPVGVRTLFQYAVLRSAPYASVSVGSVSGTFQRGLMIKNIEVKDWPLLGTGSTFLLQQMDVHIPFFDWRKTKATLFNGRLNLPNCSVILFGGTYANGKMQIKASGRELDVAVIMKPFLLPEVMKLLSGEVSDADIVLSGPLLNPHVQGRFFIEHIGYMDTVVREGWANADLVFAPGDPQWSMTGPLVIENGLVNVRRSTIELQQSRAIFKGDPENPDLAIYGTAKSDIYTIDLRILGTLERPLVQVHSDPYLSDEMALIVLGLGNWAPSNVLFQYDNDVRKIGVKKKVNDELKLGLELEQLPARGGQQPEFTKKLEGELSLTDKFSFSIVEKLYTENDGSSLSSSRDERKQEESEFYLKYRNTF